MTSNNNSDPPDLDATSEKIEKYGNPKRNFIITCLTIIIIAVLAIIIICKKTPVTGITSDYARFYPESTMIYVDVNLNSKKLNELNDSTGINIKDLSNLLNRLFVFSPNDRKRETINKLMSEAFGNSFSVGVWDDTINGKTTERSLAIFSLEREGKIQPLLKQLFSKRQKLDHKTFDGFNIVKVSDKGAYLTWRGKLYAADSFETLSFIIEKFILNNSKSLYKKDTIENSLGYLESDRIGTIILGDLSTGLTKFNNINSKKYNEQIENLKNFSKSMNSTVISVLMDKNLLYLNSYTPCNLSKIGNKYVRSAFETILDGNYTDFNPAFLPSNTISYMSIRNSRDYINLVLELYGIKQKPEYTEVKQFMKMLTSYDFDKDILEALNRDVILAAININSGKPKYAAIFSGNNGIDPIISRLVKLLQIQAPSSEISKTIYKDTDINLISSSKFPSDLYYGRINKNLYVLGEKYAVEALIDTVTNKSNLLNTKLYQGFELHDLDEPIFAFFINVQDYNNFNTIKGNILNRINLTKVRKNVKGLLLTVSSDDNTVKGSLQLRLKEKLKNEEAKK